jgi:hypothetical protein
MMKNILDCNLPNSVRGTLVKSMPGSNIVRCGIHSKDAYSMLGFNPCRRVARKCSSSYDEVPIIVLQVMMAVNEEIIIEYIDKDLIDG